MEQQRYASAEQLRRFFGDFGAILDEFDPTAEWFETDLPSVTLNAIRELLKEKIPSLYRMPRLKTLEEID